MVADKSLAHGSADIKGHSGRDGACKFILQHQPSHLGAVAVHNQKPVVTGQASNIGSRLFDNCQLIFGCGGRTLILQGIAAKGDDNGAHEASPSYSFVT